MIYLSARITIKPEVAPEKLEEAVESMRNQGRVIPSVKSFIVGRDFGGEYSFAAIYAIEDLEGLGVSDPPGSPPHGHDRAATGRQVRVLRRGRRRPV
ncbi:Dabb family protein [Amycolatopsis taiwanensis]|uniref:Dabb family protein n=1 Tax=Amycolatopsis taiwanensis TaxID=342230 RepID=UPI0004ACD7A2|nr:Dabb family protein [Amycolatopsis taiwanensis]